ncbi:MAG TPA: hypothetical protein VK670_15275 [Silvibacterium sp.]|nr:hypothetical protein [Silvibacterium sp.]
MKKIPVCLVIVSRICLAGPGHLATAVAQPAQAAQPAAGSTNNPQENVDEEEIPAGAGNDRRPTMRRLG